MCHSIGSGHCSSEIVARHAKAECLGSGIEPAFRFYCAPYNRNRLSGWLVGEQVTWATAAGAGHGSRSLVEPPGTRGGISLAACGPDATDGGLDPGEEALVPHPECSSALTASVAIPGADWRRRPSDLMLEFRLAVMDAPAVVGSVGPPPITAPETAPSTSARHRGRDGSVDKGDGRPGKGAEAGEAGGGTSWGVTRQSEWVEARPGVLVALISCASPDPRSSGFWFWCVASRQATTLSDCAACVSAASGHRCHVGQMMIDLRPVAVVWNRCSMLLRIIFERDGRGRGVAIASAAGNWNVNDVRNDRAEDVNQAGVGEEFDEGVGNGTSVVPTRRSVSAYCLARSMEVLEPGGRVAVCQQPFVDYQLSVTSAATPIADNISYSSLRGNDCAEVRPFFISIPSELLSRGCEDQWLPLDSRVLTENLLCPLVVVASRSFDAHWPSLSLRVHPGLSMRNFLQVPLSLHAVFSRPSDPGAAVSTQADDHRPSQDQRVKTHTNITDTPEEHPEVAMLDGSRVGDGLVSWPSLGGIGSFDVRDKSVVRVSHFFRTPAESLHSTWDIRDRQGCPMPFLLPIVYLEIGLCLDEETPDAATSLSSAVGLSSLPFERDVTLGGKEQPAGDRAEEGIGLRRSSRLTVKLDGDLNELVLIPWGGAGNGSRLAQENAVLPAFVKLERETVAGGVDLVRLEIHPRVMVHNATNLPISLSLLGMHTSNDDGVDGSEHGVPHHDSFPICRVRLSAKGGGSSMNMLALPGRRDLGTRPELDRTHATGRDGMGPNAVDIGTNPPCLGGTAWRTLLADEKCEL